MEPRPLPAVTEELLDLNNDPAYVRANQCFMFAMGMDKAEYDRVDAPAFPRQMYKGHAVKGGKIRNLNLLFRHQLLRMGLVPVFDQNEAQKLARKGERIVYAFKFGDAESEMHFIVEMPKGRRRRFIHKNSSKPVECLSEKEFVQYLQEPMSCTIGTFLVPQDRPRYDALGTKPIAYTQEALGEMAQNLRKWVWNEEIDFKDAVLEMKSLGISRVGRRHYLHAAMASLRDREIDKTLDFQAMDPMDMENLLNYFQDRLPAKSMQDEIFVERLKRVQTSYARELQAASLG